MHQRLLSAFTALSAAVVTPAAAQEAGGAPAAVEEVSLAQLAADMAAGRVSSEAATQGYLARIAAMDRAGPTLRSVIALNPQALEQARALDAERKAGQVRGPLHGVPILVKDNVETRELPTTAGSLALKDNATGRDAPVIARLRAAGAVILGKTNLSEWANIRSTASMSGWSAVGGLVRNPYALDRSVCGSSSGTGAAIAASFAAAGIGTETDGSVVCPSSMNGLVGLKPTIGLVSRTHIVPISHSQDTAGPMARSVRDTALLFSGMVGSDPADAATAKADAYRKDYAAGLSADALRGKRVGVVRPDMSSDLTTRFDAALAVLKAAGAVLVEVEQPELEGMGDAEFDVLKMELKSDLNAYLATTPASVKTRTLADVIAFNDANRAAEMPYFGQEIFVMAEKTGGVDDPKYKQARAKSLRLAGVEGIDAMLKAGKVELLVEPTYGAPWLSDPVHGDQFSGPSASALPAISGYPHLTVPMGLVDGLPVGLSFIGTAYSDAMLLNAGYAFEAAGKLRVKPGYAATADAGAGMEGIAQ
ncbi:amidase [Sphingomonas japonica]|uniref:Amidase n=1 Tax=Sphingomonas japonica TaxID=511662 RepID=A0ABX0TZA3_9SPHN|nr:amidase [Sphingomonas japonica]NIJ23640.1 amidase [Sphingomonas japonica]